MILFLGGRAESCQFVVIDTKKPVCYDICVIVWRCIIMAKEIYEKPIIEYTEYIVEEIMQESENNPNRGIEETDDDYL